MKVEHLGYRIGAGANMAMVPVDVWMLLAGDASPLHIGVTTVNAAASVFLGWRGAKAGDPFFARVRAKMLDTVDTAHAKSRKARTAQKPAKERFAGCPSPGELPYDVREEATTAMNRITEIRDWEAPDSPLQHEVNTAADALTAVAKAWQATADNTALRDRLKPTLCESVTLTCGRVAQWHSEAADRKTQEAQAGTAWIADRFRSPDPNLDLTGERAPVDPKAAADATNRESVTVEVETTKDSPYSNYSRQTLRDNIRDKATLIYTGRNYNEWSGYVARSRGYESYYLTHWEVQQQLLQGMRPMTSGVFAASGQGKDVCDWAERMVALADSKHLSLDDLRTMCAAVETVHQGLKVCLAAQNMETVRPMMEKIVRRAKVDTYCLSGKHDEGVKRAAEEKAKVDVEKLDELLRKM